MALLFAAQPLGVGLTAGVQMKPASYTEAQADQGRAVYSEHCASCHGVNLDDGAYGPPLTGNDFRAKWRSVDALFSYTRERMPPAQPGTLGDGRYAQLVALVLQENGASAGSAELPSDATALAALGSPGWATAGGGGLAPELKIPPATAARQSAG